jgi:signal transduction histidine kinase/DNA-binding NarL/FixJ family response regulator
MTWRARWRLPAFSSPVILALLLGVIVGATAAAVTIFQRLGMAQQQLSGRQQEESLWAVMQLHREVWRLDDALRVWRNGDSSFEALRQRMDIALSRLDYYGDGDFPRDQVFRRRDAELLAEIGPLMRQIDSMTAALPTRPDRDAASFEVRQLVRRAETLTNTLMNVVLQGGAEAHTAARLQAEELYRALGIASTVLVGVVVLALGAALAQNFALSRARRNAEAMGEQLRLTARAAEAAARTKATFLATMSHEIRTPMNGVLGAASLLAAGDLSAEQRRRVDMIAACGRALLSLIDDILDFSKLEAGRTEFERAPFAPDELLQHVADICAPMLREKALDFVASAGPGMPPHIVSDQQRLRQVLVNLVSNAVKFTESGAVVLRLATTRADRGGLWLEATVRDTGIGIAPEVIAGLFSEFQQGDTAAARRYGGAGLGLAICRRIIESLGGTIGVESEHGAGSEFWFRIPLTETAAQADRPPPRGAAAVLGPSDIVTQAMENLLRSAGWRIADSAAAADLVLVHAAQGPGALPSSARVVSFGPGGELAPPITPRALAQITDRMQSAAPPPVAVLPPMRLLVAEDNPMNRDVMEQVLRTMGHDVVMVADGAEAVAAVASQPPFDAALLDMQMPVLDGLGAARAIRAMPPPASNLLLLAVTANAMSSDRDACLAAGMDEFLAKPVTIARLTAAIGRLIGRNDTAEPEIAPPSAESVIDSTHRASLAATLREGSLTRLATGFWDEIGEDIAALEAAGNDPTARDECLHRLAGAAATLGYTEVAATARALRHEPTEAAPRIRATLRAALAADAGLLGPERVARARAALG